MLVIFRIKEIFRSPASTQQTLPKQRVYIFVVSGRSLTHTAKPCKTRLRYVYLYRTSTFGNFSLHFAEVKARPVLQE